jgi:hypothetical protein
MRLPTNPLTVLFAAILLVTSGCVTSTPQKRISQHRSAYEQFPSEVQRKISAGEVDIGFTEEMALMAVGNPGRKFTRTGPEGDSEVWVYFRREPKVGFGFAVSSGNYGSGVSSGVSVSTGSQNDEESLRLYFQEGKVQSIERIGR